MRRHLIYPKSHLRLAPACSKVHTSPISSPHFIVHLVSGACRHYTSQRISLAVGLICRQLTRPCRCFFRGALSLLHASVVRRIASFASRHRSRSKRTIRGGLSCSHDYATSCVTTRLAITSRGVPYLALASLHACWSPRCNLTSCRKLALEPCMAIQDSGADQHLPTTCNLGGVSCLHTS